MRDNEIGDVNIYDEVLRKLSVESGSSNSERMCEWPAATKSETKEPEMFLHVDPS